MKKHLLSFILLFLLMTQAKGQTSVYHPFPDSDAYWNDYYGWNDGMYHRDCGWSQYSILIDGDTTIGGRNLHHKLYISGVSTTDACCFGCDESTYLSNQYCGAIRQDTAQKKVFINLGNSISDVLLYDFNLALGDTLPVTYINQANWNFVSSIDSILIGNNYRKRFWISANLDNFGGPDTNLVYAALIEGIGSTLGLLANIQYDEYVGDALTCFNQNGQSLYVNRYGGYECGLEEGVNELSLVNFISLFPNPATNQLTIQTSLHANEAATVSIINVMGQEASPPAPLLTRGESATIDVSELPAGMYFVTVTGEKGRWVGRFVKE